MSKMDDLRAMREARYAANVASASARAAARPKPLVAPRDDAPEPTPAREAAPDPGGEALCGHRSMNGRTCTRESGHAAKSHRYS
jgi:hypothetical protein